MKTGFNPNAQMNSGNQPIVSMEPNSAWEEKGLARSEPRTYRFSDRGSGCLWIVPVTYGFRDGERSLSAVVFGYLDVFCDHKVSK